MPREDTVDDEYNVPITPVQAHKEPVGIPQRMPKLNQPHQMGPHRCYYQELLELQLK